MTDNTSGAIPAEPLGPEPIYSLDELSNACKVEATWVVELVEQGIIEAQGATVSEWRFSSVSVVRLAKATRFNRDLGLNPPGIALVFDLLGEIDRLKARLNILQGPRDRGDDHDDPRGHV